MEITWFSQRGKRTNDDRDCGCVGVRADAVLCLVLDGSTSGPTSGDFARQIARDIIDWYVDADKAVTAESLTEQLRYSQLSLSRLFPRDSASYVIPCIANTGAALVLHAGDCLLGRHEDTGIVRWLIRPHTLANVAGEMPIDEIAKSYVRHRLTRNFRATEFVAPEVNKIKAELGSSFLAATDGFWAELSAEEQAVFMEGHHMTMADEGDDRSVLCIRRLDNVEPGAGIRIGGEASANLYVRRS